MNMYEVLAKYNITEDVRFMEAFLKECYCHPYHMVEYLEDWYEAKSEFLFKLFGDKVTIDCGDICFNKSYWDIEREMYEDNELCHNRAKLSQVLGELTVATLATPKTEDCWWTRYPSSDNEYFANMIQECSSFYTLYHNGTTIKDKRKAKFVTGDERNEYVYIHKHQKVAKILNNFYRTVEKVYPKKYTEQIAEARKLTSKVLAQVAMYAGRAKTTGRLHLSIHPFDYITMSQNACGWSSCMALCDEYEDAGDYCAGTVAMMNSKNTIVAYLEADTPYYPCERGEFKDRAWNNKKYRNLIIVDPLLISAIKGYPCMNENLDDVILNKLKELALKNMGWTFENEIKHGQTRYDITGFPFSLETDKMYNDSHHWDAHYMCGKLSNLELTPSSAKKHEYNWQLRYDGPVKCLECHGNIGDSPQPRCASCRGIFICHHCGDEIHEEYAVWVDDRVYCDYCYNEHFFECDCCGEHVESGYSTNGEVDNVYVYAIMEDNNYDGRVEEYYIRAKELEEERRMGLRNFYLTPSIPCKFNSRHATALCSECLEDAIKEGYITWDEYIEEEHKSSLWKYFFLTDKAFKDEKFLDKIGYELDTSRWEGIGYEEYRAKLADMKPIKRYDCHEEAF